MKPISAFGMVSQKYLEEGTLQNNIVTVFDKLQKKGGRKRENLVFELP